MTTSEIIEAARQIVGNKEDNAVGEQFVPAEAVELELQQAIVELNEKCGTSSGKRQKTFTSVAGQQDYDLATYVSADVLDVLEVMRSTAYLPDGSLQADPVDQYDAANRRTSDGLLVPSGYQAEAMQVIEGSFRALRQSRYSWDVLYPEDATLPALRLYPAPTTAEVVAVEYTSSGASIDTLPDRAKVALTYGACVALYECMINRTNTERREVVVGIPNARSEIVTMAERQRDLYQAKYDKALARLR